MDGSTKKLRMIAIGITGLGLLFCTISSSTKHWTEIESQSSFGKFETYSGIWEECRKSTTTKCSSLDFAKDSDDHKIRTTQAFALLAILAYISAGSFLILTFMKSSLIFIFLFCIAAAAFCQMVAMAVYTDLMKETVEEIDGAKFGWSFVLGWVGFAFSLISAFVGVLPEIISMDK